MINYQQALERSRTRSWFPYGTTDIPGFLRAGQAQPGTKRRGLSAAALLMVWLFGVTVYGHAQPQSTELSRYTSLRRIVAEMQFIPRQHHGRGMVPGESITQFCSRAFADIVSGKRVRPIEPITQTDDVQDVKIAPWVRCWTSQKFIERTGATFGLGTSAFRVYRVDVDNDAQNGLEEVLYAEWDHKKPPAHFGAGFTWMDLKTCSIQGGASAFQRDTRDARGAGQITDSYAVLAQYRGRTWAIEIHSLTSTTTTSWADRETPPSEADYYLSLTTLSKPSESIGRTSCAWSTVGRDAVQR